MRRLSSEKLSGILNLYDEVDFARDTLWDINGQTFITFEFRGVIFGKEGSFKGSQALSKYVYIQYTLRDDRVLLFNFSAPYSLKSRWKDTAHQMMQSVTLK